MGGQEHFYLETHVTLAVPRGEDGEMELFVSTQSPSKTQVTGLLLYCSTSTSTSTISNNHSLFLSPSDLESGGEGSGRSC